MIADDHFSCLSSSRLFRDGSYLRIWRLGQKIIQIIFKACKCESVARLEQEEP